MPRSAPLWWLLIGAAALLMVIETISLNGAIGSDFVIFRDAALRLFAPGSPIYNASSADTLQGFIYPPPALLVLAPLALVDVHTAFLLFSWIGWVLLAWALFLWLRLIGEGNGGARPGMLASVAGLSIALVLGPVASLRFGQIDGYILAISLFSIYALRRERGILAGALLALGCWIKIYPVLLMPWMLRQPDRARFLAGFTGAAILLPAIALLFVPIEQFAIYFRDLLPHLSRGVIVNIYNQSLFAVVARGTVGDVSLTSFDVVQVAPLWRGLIYLLAVTSIAAIILRIRRTGASDLVIAAWCLALIPLIAPLGWGHAYVYALPLLLLAFTAWAVRLDLVEGVALGVATLMFVPTAHHRFGLFDGMPTLIWHAGYARYAIATAIVMALAWRYARMRNTRD